MLINLGVALAWIAMSAAGALGLATLGWAPALAPGGSAALDAPAEEDLTHEERYPLEPSLVIEAWR